MKRRSNLEIQGEGVPPASANATAGLVVLSCKTGAESEGAIGEVGRHSKVGISQLLKYFRNMLPS